MKVKELCSKSLWWMPVQVNRMYGSGMQPFEKAAIFFAMDKSPTLGGAIVRNVDVINGKMLITI